MTEIENSQDFLIPFSWFHCEIWHLRNNHRNSTLVMCHYPDLLLFLSDIISQGNHYWWHLEICQLCF